MNKRETVGVFQQRLLELIARSGMSRAQFAENAGLDRSTLTQLLSHSNVRLPRAETIAGIAVRYSASIDWLLGLSQHDQVATDIVPQLMIEPEAGGPLDERLASWQHEARGYKIRYVPSSLPDQLKTEPVLAYEAGGLDAETGDVFQHMAHARMAHAVQMESEIEVCASLQSVREFARGEGIWSDLPAAVRRQQLEYMADQLEVLYPAYRWFLFDGRERYSIPYTVFGPARAALYVGDMYFVFTSTEHIRELTRHFENLIRHATIQPNDCAGFVRQMMSFCE